MKTQKTLFGILAVVAAIALQVHAQSYPTNGLVLYNTLGSDSAISNSVYGPDLQVYNGPNATIYDVPASQAFVPGVIGTALTIGPGSYSTYDRVHDVVFNNASQYLNANSGTIDLWYQQNVDPTPYENGIIRLFDGGFGFSVGADIQSIPGGLTFDLTFGGATETVSYNISPLDGTWINVAGVWNVAGIDGTTDTMRLYVNGQEVASTNDVTWGGTVGAAADIGGGEDGDCAGQFDLEQLLVYNRSLSSNEVAQLSVVADTLDHFAWQAIPATRFVGVPFAVQVIAQDSTNNTFSNFVATVQLETTNGIVVSPAVTANFVQGIWTGQVAISQAASNVVLEATDGAGHVGLANAINVVVPPSLNIQTSGNTPVISWPASPGGFVLQTSASLSSPSWMQVPGAVNIGGEFVVPVSAIGTRAFYRLHYTGP